VQLWNGKAVTVSTYKFPESFLDKYRNRPEAKQQSALHQEVCAT